MTLGIRDDIEAMNRKRRQLNKEIEGAGEIIREYIKRLNWVNDHNIIWAEMALAVMSFEEISFSGEGIFPIVKLEIKEGDRKKHGNVEWMLIVGFEFWKDGEDSRRRLIYHPLHPELKRYDVLRELWKQGKDYPSEWDEIAPMERGEETTTSDF